jgi:hypothetical protein
MSSQIAGKQPLGGTLEVSQLRKHNQTREDYANGSGPAPARSATSAARSGSLLPWGLRGHGFVGRHDERRHRTTVVRRVLG